MGFDNECIINIQSLAGEYFCPVCRTLVYPNEALQSQCTHLYCKPCLTYVLGTTKACPYDGYLVTEADSKPLIESNKALAETIGKILVHCLFHRSGCMWQGPLSECTSHCSGCAFGNSPVVCNRCMIQIVHRQVQEHAQNCPGANPQVQQVTGSLKDAASSGAVASANSSQTSTQPGAHTLQSQVSQTSAAPPPAQDPNKQANASAQAQAVAPAAVLTTEQWYQQQYQQYYQQYPGYDPYQQSYQQYYPYQQQSAQQLQQHPSHVQGQQQPQVYPQPLTQLQPQHPPHSQQPPLPQAQAQAQAQPQTQLQPQPYAQQQPPSQHQTQIPPQGQPQSLPYVQNQVNPQQQTNLGLQPHPQGPQPQSQTQQPAHGHMPPQQQPYPQVQLHPQAQSVQPQLQQHLQAPQYQQSHPQGHQVQLQMQHSQPQLQHSVQQTQPQNHPQLHPPQPNQPQSQQLASHAVAGHHLYPLVQTHQQMQPGAPQQHSMHMHPPSGSLPQAQVHTQFPQPPLQMRPPQAHASLANQQQPNLLQSQGQVLNVPPAQQNQIRPLPQQQVLLGHQHPVLQPMQQPLQPYGQQPPFPGQVSGLVQGPLHQPVPFVQQPMQSQSRPQGPPQSLQQSSLALPPPPHSGVLAQGMPPHQSQAYVGRPVASNHAAVAQPFPQSPGAFGVAAQFRPMQLGSGQPSGHQLYSSRTTNQQVSSEQQFAQSGLATFVEGSVAEGETGSPSQKTTGKDVSGVGVNSIGVKDLKSETGEKFAEKEHKIISEGENNGAQDETPDKGADTEADAVKDGIQKIVKEEGSNGNLDPSSGGKSVDIATLDGKDGTAADTGLVEYSSVDDSSSRQAEALVGQKKDAMNVSVQEIFLSQGQVTPQGSAVDDFGGFQGKGFMHSSQLVAPSDQGRHQLPPMPYGPSSQQQRPVAPSILPSGPLPGPPSNALVPGQGPIQLRPHAPGHLPPPRQSLNPPEHLQHPGSFQDIPFGGAPTPGLRGTDQFGHHPQGSFELQPSAPQGQYNHSHLPPSQAGFPRTSQGEPAGGLALGAGPPGSFDPQGGVMGRAPPYGPEGWRPFNPVKTEMFQNQRPHYFDGRHPDFHGSGPLERGQFGQPSGNESNLPTMPGPDSTFASGLPDERFKNVNEERRNSFSSGPTRRLDQVEFEEVPKQFHTKPSNMGTEPSPKFGSSFSSSRAIDLPPHEYHYDAGLKMDRGGGAPSRFVPPYHTAGAFHSNDAGERQPQTGLHEDKRGRGDFARTQPDFLGSGPGLGRHQMDRLTNRSPGREYHGIPPRGFGLSQSALDDIDGRDTHSFGEGSRSFNLSSDPVGNSFRDGRFPVLPGQVRRGEFDGPGNFGMSEHFTNGDMMGQDFMPNHSSRGEFLGPRNVPSHMRVGDDFGAFSVSRMGELPGAGGFPVGEPFGGNKLNHPRLGEPGFRSSYSLHEFPTDGGFYAGNSDSFDRLRKRMPASMGWCRICKVDCETVEGLDLHSQTREHQKMTMDMVISIKQQNAKRQKTSKGHSSVEEGSRSRNAGIRGRGNKP